MLFGISIFLQLAGTFSLSGISLNSMLNQPLRAKIRFFNMEGLSELAIIVGMVARIEFEKAGIDRSVF